MSFDKIKYKKMKKTLITSLTFFLLIQLTGWTQKSSPLAKAGEIINESNLKKADKYFDYYAYIRAAKLYEELYEKNFRVTHVVPRLADCYRLNNDMAKAEKWLALTVEQEGIDPIYYYYYAQSLRSNSKYSESQKWIEKFNEKKTNDTRGAKYKNATDFVAKIKQKDTKFTLEPFDVINTENAEFGATFLNNNVLFSSAKNYSLSVKDQYAWNEKPFLELYIYNPDDKEKNKEGKGSIKAFNKDVNSKYHEGPVTLSQDFNTIYFTRNYVKKEKKIKSDDGTNNLMIYRSKFKDDKWTDFENLSINNKEYSVGHPSLTADGRKLFFSSNMSGGIGGTDIYYVDVNPDGTLGQPVNLGLEINTEGNEMFPFIHNSGMLFFSSDGHVGLGGLDVFYTRENGNTFNQVENIGIPINSPKDDFCFVLAPDSKTGFLSSNRDGGKGDDDIYKFLFSGTFENKISAEIIIVDKSTKAVIANAAVVVKDEKTGKTDTLTTDETGKLKIKVNPETDYRIYAVADKYLSTDKSITTKNLKGTELKETLELEKNIGFSLYCLVLDKKDKTPVKDAKVTIKDKISGKELFVFTTNESGDFSQILADAKLNDKLDFIITLSCPGYLEKTQDFTKVLDKPGQVNLHEYLDFNVDKIDIGTDLAKIIDIKPIYFDLSKWNIRPDAAAELDKIVKVMTENPKMVIELGSHTDCRSSAASNMVLSDKRAKASAEYIQKHGIGKDRIYGKGYGEAKLINGCACEGNVKSDCPEEEHQKNRRTEFIIVKM